MVVPPKKVNPEHYIFSPFGILHVHPVEGSETMTLGTWHRHSVLWQQLQSIPFFKYCLLSKALTRQVVLVWGLGTRVAGSNSMLLPSDLQLEEERDVTGAAPVPDFPREAPALGCAPLWSWASAYQQVRSSKRTANGCFKIILTKSINVFLVEILENTKKHEGKKIFNLNHT